MIFFRIYLIIPKLIYRGLSIEIRKFNFGIYLLHTQNHKIMINHLNHIFFHLAYFLLISDFYHLAKIVSF